MRLSKCIVTVWTFIRKEPLLCSKFSRFHMFLNQPEKGEEALKKAVDADPKSFWYKQTLAAYYQGKGNYPKAIYVYEDMASQFPSRLEPLMALIDLYTRTKDYSAGS